MKKYITLFFSLWLLISFFGCKNKCKEVDCGAGTCNEDDGTCNCPEGYQLNNNTCQELGIARFLGTWEGTYCGESIPHTIKITPKSFSDVYIQNFANKECTSGIRLLATADTENNNLGFFELECSNPTITVMGGTQFTIDLERKNMSASYRFFINNVVEDCILTYTKK